MIFTPLLWAKVGISVAIIAGCAGGIAWWRYSLIEQGRNEAQKVCQTEKDAANAEAQRKADALQTEADKARKEMTNAIQNLNVAHGRIVSGLRKRATRAEADALASAGAVASRCTGAELYREDGEFLAIEASRAELLRIELQRCYAQYELAAAAVK